MIEERRSGTGVALTLVVLGFTFVCCGCGGFITAAIVQAEEAQDDWDQIPEDAVEAVDTGVVEVPDSSPPPPPKGKKGKGGKGKRPRR